jgi:hypothetical protein
MKSPFRYLLVAGTAGTLFAGTPAEDLKAGIQKLADSANYSWVSSIELPGMPFTPPSTMGKTVKGGATLLSQEGMDGNTTVAVLKDGKGVVQLQDGWKSAEELPTFGRPPGGGGGGPRPGGPGNGGPGGPGNAGPGGPGGGPGAQANAGPGGPGRGPGGPGGPGGGPGGPGRGPGGPGGGPGGPGGFAAMMARVMLQAKTPTAELADMVDKIKDLKSTKPGIFVGNLPEDVVKPMLSFGPGPGGGPQIKDAKGSAKFWVKDGVLSKYEIEAGGTMNMFGEEREMTRVVTIEIKDAGQTKIEIPAEAEKKLETAKPLEPAAK